MTTSSKILDRFRSRLAKIVEKERLITGCLALATKRSASRLGVSPMWVRRVLHQYSPVKVQAHHYIAVLMQTFGKRKAVKNTRILSAENSARAGLNA